jgi:type IV secretion system protein VirB4
VLGRTGSGKTAFANAAIDWFLKNNPYVLILDGLGGSYRQLTQKHGGNYFELTISDEKQWPFTFNPLQLPPTRRTRQHLAMLLRMCMMSGGYRPTAAKSQILWERIGRVLTLPFSERRLSRLELPPDMQPYLAPWIGDGQYGYVFDNEIDSFAMSKFQTVDLSDMGAYPEVLQPLIWHLTYLWSNLVDNPDLLPVPKLMVLDETWAVVQKNKMLRPIKRYIETACRTWRKRNAGIMLVSQSLDEYEKANMFDILNELCPTKALMYSPGADFDHYAEELKLNQAEKEQWIALKGKGDLFLKTNRRSKTLKIPLDPLALATYRNDPDGNWERDQLQKAHGFEKGLELFAQGLKQLAKGA